MAADAIAIAVRQSDVYLRAMDFLDERREAALAPPRACAPAGEIVPLLRDTAARDALRAAAGRTGTRAGTENVLALVDAALAR